MSTDVGIPIGGVVAITGASNIPDNFAVLDGSVLDTDGRSELDGYTMPDWNSQEVTPVGVSSLDEATGEVVGTGIYETTLDWDMFDEEEYEAYTTVTFSSESLNSATSAATDSSDDMNLSSGASALFDTSYNYFSGTTTSIGTVYADSEGGDGYGLLYEDGTYKECTMTHTHLFYLMHNSSHDLELEDSTDPACTMTFTATQDLTSNVTSDDQVSIEFPILRDHLTVYWCMRVY